MNDLDEESGALFETRVGTTLRDARLARNLDLKDIAAETRVPLRSLVAIEDGDYAKLPAPTYSAGFVKSYAREVGLDGEALSLAFRAELRSQGPDQPDRDFFQATDPARVPPRMLAWVAALTALAILIGYGAWRSGMFGEDADDRARLAAGTDQPAAISPVDRPADPERPAPQARPTGPVVLTATDVVWLRVYDLESDDVVVETELQPGERFEVPGDVANPAIRVGRAQALEVTVGGRRVAPLGPPSTTLSDISLRPADLVARRAAPVARDEAEAEAEARPGFGRP